MVTVVVTVGVHRPHSRGHAACRYSAISFSKPVLLPVSHCRSFQPCLQSEASSLVHSRWVMPVVVLGTVVVVSSFSSIKKPEDRRIIQGMHQVKAIRLHTYCMALPASKTEIAGNDYVSLRMNSVTHRCHCRCWARWWCWARCWLCAWWWQTGCCLCRRWFACQRCSPPLHSMRCTVPTKYGPTNCRCKGSTAPWCSMRPSVWWSRPWAWLETKVCS